MRGQHSTPVNNLAWLPLDMLARLPGRPLYPLPIEFGRRRWPLFCSEALGLWINALHSADGYTLISLS